MKKTKSILSIFLIFTLVLSMCAVLGVTQAGAASDKYNLKTTQLSNGIILKWKNQGSNRVYNVEYYNGKSWQKIAGGLSETQFIGKNPAYGKTYTYRIKEFARSYGSSYKIIDKHVGTSKSVSVKYTDKRYFTRAGFLNHCKKHIGKTGWRSGVFKYFNIGSPVNWDALYVAAALNCYTKGKPKSGAAQLTGFNTNASTWVNNIYKSNIYKGAQYNPKVGDIVFISAGSRSVGVGIVSKVYNKGNIVCIKGNEGTSNCSTSYVAERRLTNSIIGYIDTGCFLK